MHCWISLQDLLDFQLASDFFCDFTKTYPMFLRTLKHCRNKLKFYHFCEAGRKRMKKTDNESDAERQSHSIAITTQCLAQLTETSNLNVFYSCKQKTKEQRKRMPKSWTAKRGRLFIWCPLHDPTNPTKLLAFSGKISKLRLIRNSSIIILTGALAELMTPTFSTFFRHWIFPHFGVLPFLKVPFHTFINGWQTVKCLPAFVFKSNHITLIIATYAIFVTVARCSRITRNNERSRGVSWCGLPLWRYY